MEENMEILIITGSISQKSHTRALMQELNHQLNLLKANTNFWDLRQTPLPIANPEYHWSPDNYPDNDVQKFFSSVRNCDGIALGSPLYHGSFSGVLKNALDLLWYDAFRNKPVALLSHGSSVRRCTQPCQALQPVVKTLYGYSIQTQVGTTKPDYVYDNDNIPTLDNADIKERVRRQAVELVQIANLLKGQDIIKED